MPAPNFQAVGTFQGVAAASATVPWPAHQTNDVAFLVIECQANAPSLTTAAGFALVGTALSTTGTRLTVYWNRATSGAMASPVIAANTDHTAAQIITFRGVRTSGNPWEDVQTSVNATASTTQVNPAVTTLGADRLIVGFLSSATDATGAWHTSQTNANLTGLAERMDNGTNNGNGGGIAAWSGVDPTPGSTGTTSNSVTSTASCLMTLALVPAAIDMTASGSTTTNGTATPLLNLAVAASGSTVTDGTATIDLPGSGPVSHPVTASGSTTTDGTATAQLALAAAASGSTVTDGTATPVLRLALTGSGSTTTNGAGALALLLALAGSGSTTTDGTATIAIPGAGGTAHPVTASGSTTTDGTASPRLLQALVASGALVTTGQGTLQLRLAASGSGSATLTGGATLALLNALTGSGSVTITGGAALALRASLAASGALTADGTATVGLRTPVTASGSAVTDGTATLTMGTLLVVRFIGDADATIAQVALAPEAAITFVPVLSLGTPFLEAP